MCSFFINLVTLNGHEFSKAQPFLKFLMTYSGSLFQEKETVLYLACNDKKAFFTSAVHYRGYHLLSCQNVIDALSFL